MVAFDRFFCYVYLSCLFFTVLVCFLPFLFIFYRFYLLFTVRKFDFLFCFCLDYRSCLLFTVKKFDFFVFAFVLLLLPFLFVCCLLFG
jgi:hypothetical protein